MTRRLKTLLPALALLLLVGCGENTARTLGFIRDAPDEFRVTTRAPLSMPPDMAGGLPPPRPGAPRPMERSARDEAEAVRLDGASECEVILASAPIEALAVVEDELLLSLPFAPRHEQGCGADAPARD
jgi:hypothetical protein